MLFRRKRRQDQPTPPWVMWLVLGFAALAAYNAHHGPNAAKFQETLKNARNNLAPDRLLPLQDYKNLVLPSFNSAMREADVKVGGGAPAVCGETVKLAYRAFDGDKEIGDKASADTPLIFRIGEGKAMPALEQGVIGMRVGGQRNLFAPYSLSYGAEGFKREEVNAKANIRFEMDLLDVSPVLPGHDDSPYRIANLRNGNGDLILCGTPAKVRVTLWDVGGKKLYSTPDKEPLTFTPGKSEVFIGLEQGVIGMQAGGVRTLIVPPGFQKTMSGDKPGIDFPLPGKQTVLVDVEAIP